MGVVYSAYDPELDRQVAIKLLHSEPGGSRGEGQARLLREAQAIARISHPNVVAVHDVGTFDGAVFVTMEFVRGESLAQWLESADRSADEIVAAFAQAARGLHAAHEAGVVHRDFKPENALVGRDGRVRVLDFGLAHGAALDGPQAVGPSGESAATSTSSFDIVMTAPGAVMGTPAYMAPEQHRQEATDGRTDQFSFCVALWEALTGERPFEGDTLTEIAMHVIEGEIRDSTAEARIPSHLRPVLRRGLAVEPGARFPSMSPLLVELERDIAAGRRRVAAVVGTLALGVGAGLLALRPSAGEAPPCRAGDSMIADAWNAERSSAAAGAYASTGLAYAPDTWKNAAPRLDHYAAAWSKAYRDACEATHVRGEQSEDLLDRRMICLDASRQALMASAEVLDDPDKQVVLNTQRIVDHLPELSACSDRDALASGVAPPSDEGRVEMDSLRALIARARAAESAGKVKEAAAPAAEILRRAEAAAYAPVTAEALALRGDTLIGDDEEAGLAFTLRAFSEALSARHDAFASQVAAGLAYTYAYGRQDLSQAHHWLSLAETMIRRTGKDPQVQAQLMNVRAVLALREGKFDEAEAQFIAMAAVMREEESMNLSSALGNLGAFYAERGEVEKAAPYMREAIEIDVAAYGEKHPSVLRWMNNLGTLHLIQGQLDEARTVLEKSVKIQEEVLGEDHVDLGATLNNLAIIYRRQGDLDRSEATHRRVLRIREKAFGPKSAGVAETLGNLAAVLTTRDRHEDALALNHRMLGIIVEEFGAESVKAGDAMSDVARALNALERYEDGLNTARRAAAIFDAGEPRADLVAANLRVISASLRHLKRGAEAVEYAERGLTLIDGADRSDRDRATARFELARALVAGSRRGRPRALQLAREALDLHAASDNTADDQSEAIREFLLEYGGAGAVPGNE
jgi:tetratricopeptide (TPR) repeat protein